MIDPVNSMDLFVACQVDKLVETWSECGTAFPIFPRSYTLADKKQNEGLLTEQLNWLIGELEISVQSSQNQDLLPGEAAQRFKQAGKVIFDMTDPQVNTIENEGIAAVGSQFFQSARRFDPGVSTADIFQASRNVWTMNYLQVLLDLPVRLTPSVFAYSMLYPVTDNYLDDPGISNEEKRMFNRRFTAWLMGENEPPVNGKEQKVRQLVKMIESEYPRKTSAGVYESLLAIQSAQQKSLHQRYDPSKAAQIKNLRIAIEKGGTSVLADGILTAGSLPEWQSEIIFNYGAFAQFMDDQEDVAGDLKQKAVSVFTEAARKGHLDQTMNRLFSFSRTVLKDLHRFDHSRSRPLMEISLKGIDLLLIDACARTSKFYSRRYLAALEEFFPFRFKYLAEVRKQIDNKKPLLTRFLEGVTRSSPQKVPEWALELALR